MGNPACPQIVLTFDDGPDPVDTPHLLEVLNRHEVVATFFVLGERAAAFPHLIRDIHAAGHQIGLHGYWHTHFPLVDAKELHTQLDTTRNLISAASGCELSSIRDVRPPYGTFLPGTLMKLLLWNYRPVMWSSVPLHWLQSVHATVQQVVEQMTNGMLLVLHEGTSGGPAVAELTDYLVPLIKSANLTCVSVDEMWRSLTSTSCELERYQTD